MTDTEVIDLTHSSDESDSDASTQYDSDATYNPSVPFANVAVVHQTREYLDLCVGTRRMSGNVSNHTQRFVIRKRIRADLIQRTDTTPKFMDRSCFVCYEDTVFTIAYNCRCDFTRVLCNTCGSKLGVCAFCKAPLLNKERVFMFNGDVAWKYIKT